MASTTESIAQEIEGITRRVVEAVNSRSWNPSSDPWNHFARHRIVPPWWDIWHNAAVHGGRDKNAENCIISGHHFMDFERHLTILAPEFHCRIVEVKATYVSAKSDIGIVMLVLEQTGMPPGVTRSSVCELDFRRGEGDGGGWLCKELREIPGLVGFDGVSFGQVHGMDEPPLDDDIFSGGGC